MKASSLGIYMEKLWQAGDKSYFVERRDERGNPKLDKISSFLFENSMAKIYLSNNRNLFLFHF